MLLCVCWVCKLLTCPPFRAGYWLLGYWLAIAIASAIRLNVAKLWDNLLLDAYQQLTTTVCKTPAVCKSSVGQNYLGKPDRTCRPSTFWLMRYLRYPALCSPRRAMWVKLGRASSNVVSKWGDSPFSSNVHTPFGPLEENIAMNRLVIDVIRIGQVVMQWVDWKYYVLRTAGGGGCAQGWV